MVIFVTVLFGTAVFILIRLGQAKYSSPLITRNILIKTNNKGTKLQYYNKVLINFIAVYTAKLPLGRYRLLIGRRLIFLRSEKMYSPDEFLSYKILMSVTGSLVYLGLFNTFDISGLAAVILLFRFPEYELRKKKEKYERDILKELPFALDLVIVCVEAGLTFDAAVAKYIYGGKKTSLRNEFEQYLKSMGMGENREKGLKALSERVNLRDFTSLIYTVLQSEKLGTGIAGSLRLKNSDLRVSRKQRAEKMAIQTPVKLMLPLVVFILPVIFIVILGPVVLRIITDLK